MFAFSESLFGEISSGVGPFALLEDLPLSSRLEHLKFDDSREQEKRK